MNFKRFLPFKGGGSTPSDLLPMPFEGPDWLARHKWRLNNSRANDRPRIEQDSEGALVLQIESNSDTHLIHNGTSGEFKQLNPASGLPMANGSCLTLNSEIVLDGEAQVRIQILEFDEHGQRIGKARLRTNAPVTYSPAPGVARAMLTLLIQGHGRVKVRNISVHPVPPVEVPFLAPEQWRHLGWRLNHRPDSVAPKIKQDNEGGLVLELDSDRNTYLIHNGTSSEFKQLKPGSGLLVERGSSLNLGSDVILEGDVRASILILEFDEQGQRIGKTRLPVNKPVSYTPASDVARALLTLMMQGVGSAVIRKLTVDPIPPLKLPFDGPAQLASQGWRLNYLLNEDRPNIEQDEDGKLVVDLAEEGDVYLIHNGSSSEFKRLKPGSGFRLESGWSLNFDSEIIADGDAQTSILILEFDEEGRRIGKTRLPINIRVPYAPGPSVERVMLALMIKGPGRVVVRSLSVDPAASNLTHRILSELAAKMPVSNGSSYGATIPLSVAIVTDEFMYNFYRGAFAELHYLSPGNFEEVLSTRRIDAFLYVTAWSGLHDDEWRGVGHREVPASALRAILRHCRENGITTLFQSIEDPSNFEHFIEIAKLFDCIFTADADTIETYKERVGHEQVFYGEYGANPLLHNPIGCRRQSINGAFFAGSYPRRYAERCEDMETIFSSLVNAGACLVIADRNFGRGSADLVFPERWWPYVIPKFDHETLQAVHKLFRYNINLNSIKHSSTMCAMRVYELRAQGRHLISNYARSTYNRFPDVITVPNRMRLNPFFKPESLEDYRSAMAGVRGIMNGLTNVDVAGRMLAKAGFPAAELKPRAVAVIADELTPEVTARFAAQSYPARVLLDVATVRDPAAWEEAKRQLDIAFFCFFSADDEYEPGYLADLVNGFKYTASSYVSKASWFDGPSLQDGPQHEFIAIMPGRARSMFAASAFGPAAFVDLAPHQAVPLQGGYAVDPFELNYRRYLAVQRSDVGDAALSVVVPVFDNGRFLAAKCMPSLMRNTLWPRMEIILVDDGSSDAETKELCTFLAGSYPNVRLFEFNDGGSGSASRPRNKGLELATAPLVAFLDPDNEISPGGYDTLLQLYEELAAKGQKVPFVSGYQVKVGEVMAVTGHHTSEAIEIVEDLHAHFFDRGRFPVVSTQAAVIDRSLLDRTGLRFVEGAAGQDTLFGWELMAHAKRAAFTSDAFLLYYAERAGSITNAISVDYFRKKLVLEKEQRKRLEALGLLSPYLEHHFETFFRNWYEHKLKDVRPEERHDAEAILHSIVALYGRDDLMAEQQGSGVEI